MQLPLSGSGSIYLQIAAMIENNILQDILLEEEQAPSTNEMARLYSINPATAAKGLNLLAEEGIVYKKRGLGMFVTKGAKEIIREKRKAAFYEDYVKPLIQEAKSLGMEERDLQKMMEKALLEQY